MSIRIADMKDALPHKEETTSARHPKKLTTVWGENLNPDRARGEYPRPRLVRAQVQMLNGYWDYAITKTGSHPKQFDGQILVPFSPEADLSGVNRQLMPGEYLWYERRVHVSDWHAGLRCLLHIGAADQHAAVYVNGKKAAVHTGGYLPFTVDITRFLEKLGKKIVLSVRVQDFSDTSYHSRGKQKLAPGGMYYTAQSGIWQSVWLETVPEAYIEDVTAETDPSLNGTVYFSVRRKQAPAEVSASSDCGGRSDRAKNHRGSASALCYDSSEPGLCSPKMSADKSEQINLRIFSPTCIFCAEEEPAGEPILEQTEESDHFAVKISDVRLWSPEEPWLYPMEIRFGEDQVRSYFAVRTFSVEKDERGIPRVCLNHEPIFLNGVLDQGYWPDGLYTVPSDEAFVYDILQMKYLGFNMLRKHAKIEDPRWYYHCDRLGMLVWQDMVNGGGKYSALLLTYLPTGICVPGPLKKNEANTKPNLQQKADDAGEQEANKTKNTKKTKNTEPVEDYAAGGEREKKSGRKRCSPRAGEWLMRRITGRKSAAGRREFRRECAQTIELLKGHPCVMTWVLFNEGWGQFDTEELTGFIQKEDPARLVDSASGWFEHKTGDFKSVHNYFRKLRLYRDVRAQVLSEYGGYVYHMDEHSQYESTYGYHTCTTAEEFWKSFLALMRDVRSLEKDGLCGAVYTQVSDIEEETNGLLTYDRKECKLAVSESLARCADDDG